MSASPTSATRPPRPLPWLPPLVHAVVLGGGVYAGTVAAGPPADPLRLGGFTTCLLLLAALDRAEAHRHPGRTPFHPALLLLLARIALSAVAAALDGSGVARALFVLLPLSAYFAFGRRAGIALGVGCGAVVLAGNTLWAPGWYVRPGEITDLLMSGLALVLAVSMATVAAGEQEARHRLTHTLDELRDAHGRLTDYAARVARLSTVRERNRLAREFHDGLGHHLTAIAVQLEKASAFQDRDPDTARQALADARRSADQALDDVRRSVRAMRDEDGPEPFSLSAALADLARQADGGGPAVTLDLSGDEHGHRAEALTALYRAAQEGLTNARRHAGATKVRLSARYGEHEARLVVADDGSGFRADARTGDAGDASGFGLRAMRERLALLGGRVEVDTGPGRGTTVTARVPRVPAPTPETDR
ncbi:sensor histidine kinase [Streptomyces sp. NBC_01351]|uniref:sensor histidine kinase n=1 Tax=Streptomyces sp. NBC_01351 TaxID=2903833 RepID=UPI002E3797F4|nr:sensor histidine kinase [Streptomyces sp. NBC_01351]